jgi:hypothetical protein
LVPHVEFPEFVTQCVDVHARGLVCSNGDVAPGKKRELEFTDFGKKKTDRGSVFTPWSARTPGPNQERQVGLH